MSRSLAALALVLLSGCVATVGPPEVVGGFAVTTTSAPAYVERYPRVWYDGGWAYLVDDNWYYSTPRGWVVFREEPPTLYQYRHRHRSYVQEAPPAQRAPYAYPQRAPHAYPQRAPYAYPQRAPHRAPMPRSPQQAPPAHRVR